MRKDPTTLLKGTCLFLGAWLLIRLASALAGRPDLNSLEPPTLASIAPPAPKEEEKSSSSKSSRSGPSSSSRRRPGGSSGGKSSIPPETQARVDLVVQSEIFGAIPRPLPMAVLGFVGNEVLLRTDSGQTDLVQEGATLGNVKILKIGINRVLVEVDGSQRELTLYNGLGGDSLKP